VASPAPAQEFAMSPGRVFLFAFCCGAIVANIYYAQPIIAVIAAAVGMSAHVASLIVSLTQAGYALGLFFLVPLGDLVESRRLLLSTAMVATLCLAAAAFAQSAAAFLALSLLLGFSSVSVQILIPLAAHFCSPESRGRVVGGIMGGLLLGIMLARPLSSVVEDHFGWRAVFAGAAVLMLAIVAIIFITMPRRVPPAGAGYFALIRSLATLMKTLPPLRQRSFYQACMFASFSLFWTAVPLELSRHYGFSQSQIALFALIGATGAIAAPISGRVADAGHTRSATIFALLVASLCFLPAWIAPAWGYIGLAATGVVLDFCVQTNMVLGQRTIFALDHKSGSRLNALYTTSLFIGGAVGSSLASTLYENGGWMWIVTAGSIFPLLALIRFTLDQAGKTAP
jgi:predicted MFS family arabinose efflux permease